MALFARRQWNARNTANAATKSASQQVWGVRERCFAIFTAEHGQHFSFDLDRHAARRFLPCDEKFVGFCQLPDQSTAPMANRFARAEICKLANASSKLVCLGCREPRGQR